MIFNALQEVLIYGWVLLESKSSKNLWNSGFPVIPARWTLVVTYSS